MNDLLTNDEISHAEKQGWQLCHVYDQGTAKWLVEVLPAKGSAVRSARAVQAVVLNFARNRDAVALRAMSLVMNSHAPQKPKRKKK